MLNRSKAEMGTKLLRLTAPFPHINLISPCITPYSCTAILVNPIRWISWLTYLMTKTMSNIPELEGRRRPRPTNSTLVASPIPTPPSQIFWLGRLRKKRSVRCEKQSIDLPPSSPILTKFKIFVSFQDFLEFKIDNISAEMPWMKSRSCCCWSCCCCCCLGCCFRFCYCLRGSSIWNSTRSSSSSCGGRILISWCWPKIRLQKYTWLWVQEILKWNTDPEIFKIRLLGIRPCGCTAI